MVQGENIKNSTIKPFERDQSSKRAGFESMQQKHLERNFKQTPTKDSMASSKTKSTETKYGAWGPVLQNREHFNSMHFC